MKLKHVVIIPDGNRRWAKKRSRPAFFGHREGAITVEKILKAALELKIPYFTFWGCSVGNITKRSKVEVKFLFKLFDLYFKKLLKSGNLQEHEVRVNVLGRWREMFSKSLVKTIDKIILETKDNNKFNLTLLMAYSGVDEMVEAIKNVSDLKNKNPKLVIDGKLIKENLWTKDLPPVDLVIRTGGEPHWSQGLMMFDVAESQLYFTNTLWPDFSEKEFKIAVGDYKDRGRRFGK